MVEPVRPEDREGFERGISGESVLEKHRGALLRMLRDAYNNGRASVANASDANRPFSEVRKPEAHVRQLQIVLENERRQHRTIRDALGRATVRLRICQNRMEACEEEHPDTHRVSLAEIPAWIAEHEQTLMETI